MPQTIISLTTIPPRMARIGTTLDSLLRQTAPIAAIILWVPERYRRDGFGSFDPPDPRPGVELRRCPVDYGPATKILPAVAAFRGQDVRILYCDDDRIYHPEWAARLLEESDRYPGDCIAAAGRTADIMALRSFSLTRRYRYLAIATLGIRGHFNRKKIRALARPDGLIDIAMGYGGVLVRPEHLPDSAFDIPELLWTVDDIWLSGQMALNGVTIRKAAPEAESVDTELASVSALFDLVYADHGRGEANLACMRYFQERFGIWMEAETGRQGRGLRNPVFARS